MLYGEPIIVSSTLTPTTLVDPGDTLQGGAAGPPANVETEDAPAVKDEAAPRLTGQKRVKAEDDAEDDSEAPPAKTVRKDEEPAEALKPVAVPRVCCVASYLLISTNFDTVAGNKSSLPSKCPSPHSADQVADSAGSMRSNEMRLIGAGPCTGQAPAAATEAERERAPNRGNRCGLQHRRIAAAASAWLRLEGNNGAGRRRGQGCSCGRQQHPRQDRCSPAHTQHGGPSQPRDGISAFTCVVADAQLQDKQVCGSGEE